LIIGVHTMPDSKRHTSISSNAGGLEARHFLTFSLLKNDQCHLHL
jgi:hypothetical protein